MCKKSFSFNPSPCTSSRTRITAAFNLLYISILLRKKNRNIITQLTHFTVTSATCVIILLVWSPVGNTFRPVVKCNITKQIVTDNKVIIHVVLDRPHIPCTLNGCHGLGRSILSVTLYQKCCYDQRKYCFWNSKSLICSVDYDVHPDAGCA